MTRGVRAVFAAVLVTGVTAVGISLWTIFTHEAPRWWLPIMLGIFGAVGEIATISGDPDEGEQAFSFATTAHLASAMLLPPGWAALTAFVGSGVGEVVGRARAQTVALNASLATFSTLAASAAFHAIEDGRPLGVHTYLGVAAMLAAYIPLNLTPPGLVTTMMSKETMRPLAWLPPADFLAYVMEACLAAAVVLVVTATPAFLLFLVPLIGAVFLALKRSRLLAREARGTLRALVSVIDAKDPSTAAHSERVGDMAARLGEALGLGTRHVRDLRWAGRLHDIGKIAVDDAVLRKTGPLDDVEWELMRRHPAVAAEILESLSVTRSLTAGVRYHHERADGTGYYLVAGEDVPLDASIIAIVDAFDAMTSARPYRPALAYDEALGRIQADAGAHFDPEVVAAFVAMMQGRRVEAAFDGEGGWRTAINQRLRDIRRAGGQVAPERPHLSAAFDPK